MENTINGEQQNYPAQGDYSTYGYLMDYGMGVGALQTGQPYSVFRLNPSSGGDVVQTTNLLYSGFPVFREYMTGADKQGFEGTISQEIYWFALTGDFSASLVGDVFVLNDPVYGIGGTQATFNQAIDLNGFIFTIHTGLKTPLGARIDRTISIYRPSTTPDANGVLDTTSANASPVILQNGYFSLSSAGQRPAKIPAGLLPIRRARGPSYPGIPDVAPKSNWSCFTIPLPGFQPIEGDIIVASDSSRYRIVHPFTQDVGVVGCQWILEREVSSVGWPAF